MIEAIIIILAIFAVAMVTGAYLFYVVLASIGDQDIRIERIERELMLKPVFADRRYRYSDAEWASIGIVFPRELRYTGRARGYTAEELSARYTPGEKDNKK